MELNLIKQNVNYWKDFDVTLSLLELYTDGAVEEKKMSFGAVLCDPDGTSEYFMFNIDEPFVSTWHAAGIRHAVAQSEMLPVIMSKMLWKDRIRDRSAHPFLH